MTPRFLAAVPWLFAAAAPAAARQQTTPGGVVQERATAIVVEIPVNVIGKDGRPIAGLKKEDFELYDDGKHQPISALQVIDLVKPVSSAASGAAREEIPASARRLWLLVFDLSYTSPSGLLRARDGARDFVTTSMTENDLAAVGTLSMETGWKLLVNFTRDRFQLASAIETLGLPSIATRSADPLAFAYTSPSLSGTEGTGIADEKRAAKANEILESLRDIRNLQRQSNDEMARGRIVKLFNSFAGIGRVLDSVRGRKHVLFFSEGFETRLLSGKLAGGGRDASLQQGLQTSSLDASTPQGANEAALSGEVWKIDSDARFGSASLRDVLAASLSMFRRSDAVLDSVDISGLRAEGDAGGPKPGSGTDALFAMASETDGDFVRNANRLGGELQKVSERTNLVYLLVYQPKSSTAPGTFHKLKVDVKAPGARVLARSGYTEPRPYRSLSPLEQLLASGDLLTGGEKEQALSARLLAAPFAARGDVPQVPILIEIPGAELLAGEAGEKTVVQIYAYANDASGTLADYLATELTLDLSKVRQTLESGGIKYYGTFYLPPGDYSLRALVRSAASGRSGVVSARVRVPRMPGGEPTVLPPFFSEPEGRWAMVRGNPRSDAPPRAFEYPFVVGGESFVPSVLPQVGNGATARLAVVTYNFGGDARRSALQARGEVVAADGTARPVELKTVRESDRERAQARKLFLAFQPEGLAPGRYALKVAVMDPETKVSAESSSVFEIK